MWEIPDFQREIALELSMREGLREPAESDCGWCEPGHCVCDYSELGAVLCPECELPLKHPDCDCLFICRCGLSCSCSFG